MTATPRPDRSLLDPGAATPGFPVARCVRSPPPGAEVVRALAVVGSLVAGALVAACGPTPDDAGGDLVTPFAEVGALADDDPLGLPAELLTAAARGAADELVAARDTRDTVLPRRRVVVLGSRPDLFGDDLAARLERDVEVVRADHPAMQPFEVLCWTPAVIEAAPELVVIGLSLRDTFGPLAVGPRPGGQPAPAFDALADRLGPDESEARREVEALSSSGAEHATAGRQVLTLQAEAPLDVDLAGLLAEWEADATRDAVPYLSRQARGMERVVAGRHAAVAHGLLARAVEQFVAAGIPVVLIEAPLHPATRRLHQRALRNDFLEALADVLAGGSVELILETQMGPFPSTDFVDLGTLSPDGRSRAAAQAVRRLRDVLDRGGPG